MREPFAASVKDQVSLLGGGFMISRHAKAAATEHGLRDVWSAYFLGRCGVLGDVHPDVVAAATVFYPVDVVREAWTTGRAAVAPDSAADRYGQACHEWGRARLEGFTGAARLAELAGTVAAEADVSALPLFAGWRAMPLPDDPAARCAQALHVLREHRGGLHAVAVLAAGLTPRQAVLSGKGGEANAVFFGWDPPYEDVSGLAGVRADAEALTDRLVQPAYAVLDDAEQAELRALLDAAKAHAFPAR
jgi:hypothetical protein